MVVNNSYLGLIRQSQRGFQMDYCVQLAFENVNAPELDGYGVDHVKVAEGLGCKALRVRTPGEIVPALERAKALMAEHRVPVVVEIILERVTNIAMGTEIDKRTSSRNLCLDPSLTHRRSLGLGRTRARAAIALLDAERIAPETGGAPDRPALGATRHAVIAAAPSPLTRPPDAERGRCRASPPTRRTRGEHGAAAQPTIRSKRRFRHESRFYRARHHGPPHGRPSA